MFVSNKNYSHYFLYPLFLLSFSEIAKAQNMNYLILVMMIPDFVLFHQILYDCFHLNHSFFLLYCFHLLYFHFFLYHCHLFDILQFFYLNPAFYFLLSFSVPKNIFHFLRFFLPRLLLDYYQ